LKSQERNSNSIIKFPKVRLCESQISRPLVFAFPAMHPLLMAGKFRESYAKERAKIKIYIKGDGPVIIAKKN